jgi:hypothetical protein
VAVLAFTSFISSSESILGKADGKSEKNGNKMGQSSSIICRYPLVICYIAIENDPVEIVHIFPLKMVDLSIVMAV